MEKAAAAVERLLFDISYTLAALPWLEAGDVRYRWLEMREEARGTENAFFPHLPSTFTVACQDGRPTARSQKGTNAAGYW